MREQTGGQAEVEVAGATVKAALDDLVRQYPALGPKLFDNGKLRPFVNVFVNDEDIRYLDDLDTAVKDGEDRRADPRRGRGLTWPSRPTKPTRSPTGPPCSR